jgi:antitoxin component YwqK of YwqJK toxin-antitoxin module
MDDQHEIKREYWDSDKLKQKFYYKDGKLDGLTTI